MGLCLLLDCDQYLRLPVGNINNLGALAGLSPAEFYSVVQWPLTIVQSLAFLEIVHAVTRLVPSPVGPTTLQVFSRLFLVFVTWQSVPSQVSYLAINDPTNNKIRRTTH